MAGDAHRPTERPRDREQAFHCQRRRGDVEMISRIIAWCEENRFLVFTAVALLTLGGLWSLRNMPLDALPGISDVQAIIHTSSAGQPPSVIEDHATEPIVTPLLASPR